MSFLKGLFTYGGNRWWLLPKTSAQEPNPPHEGPVGEIQPALGRWWMRLTSGNQHATPGFYWWVAITLGMITGLEVWLFNEPFHRYAFIPIMMFLSAMKFVMVIMFFMHLRFDHKLYRYVFGGCMIGGLAIFIALLALSRHFGAGY